MSRSSTAMTSTAIFCRWPMPMATSAPSPGMHATGMKSRQDGADLTKFDYWPTVFAQAGHPSRRRLDSL